MAKKTRTPADVVAQARRADREARRLEALAADVNAKVQQMEAESVDALVNNPDAAGNIGAQIDAQARLGRAYREKAAHHRREVERFKLEALAVDAAALLADAETLEADADKHAAKVDALLSQLEDLDGVAYEVAPSSYDVVGEPSGWGVPGAERMRQEARVLRRQGAHSLHYSSTGDTAETLQELRTSAGDDWLPPLSSGMSVMEGQRLTGDDVSPLLSDVISGAWLEDGSQ